MRACRPEVGRIRALEYRSTPLRGSDRRPNGGADERQVVVLSDEKTVYVAYTLYPKRLRLFFITGALIRQHHLSGASA